jgi:hypothetical protein
MKSKKYITTINGIDAIVAEKLEPHITKSETRENKRAYIAKFAKDNIVELNTSAATKRGKAIPRFPKLIWSIIVIRKQKYKYR